MAEEDVWARTLELRMFHEPLQAPPRLQQLWRSDSGQEEWRDVPHVWGGASGLMFSWPRRYAAAAVLTALFLLVAWVFDLWPANMLP